MALPFFWFPVGQVDFGGDSGRLYFFDPYAFLYNASLYPQVPGGTGVMLPAYYHIPFIAWVMLLSNLLDSPWALNNLFNGLKLFLSFISIYLIVMELGAGKSKDKKDSKLFLAAMCSGIFYILAPSMAGNMERALLSHNQIFLNPLMFYLLLKFFLSNRYIYGWVALGVTVLFAPNFGFPAMPAFFAFYPLAILFIMIYVLILKKKNISIRNTLLLTASFIGLQAFHLIPQLINLLEPDSYVNMRLFDSKAIVHEGVRYFISILPIAKASNNFFYTIDISVTKVFSSIMVALIILGLYLNKPRNRTILLLCTFFLITFFLMTANITSIGVEIYKNMFYIPGFSMFRNFIGQWQFVFAFFYSLLLGCSLYAVFNSIGSRRSWWVSGLIVVLLLIVNRNFINGSVVNKMVNDTSGFKTGVIFDPQYINSIAHFKNHPYDYKILSLPLTDCCYQVVKGVNSGAYIGTTPIAHLTGKNDFTGYQTMNPFPDLFLKLAQDKNYLGINKLLAILNVEYIYHNSDPDIYDAKFPKQPFEYVRQSLPSTQKDYTEFIEKLGAKKMGGYGYANIYMLSGEHILPHIYSPSTLVAVRDTEDLMKRLPDQNPGNYVAYIEEEICVNNNIACDGIELSKNYEKLYFEKINPTKYLIRIENASGRIPLIFSEAYHPGWRIYPVENIQKDSQVAVYANATFQGREKKKFIDGDWWNTIGKKPLFSGAHFVANGYANGWFIDANGDESLNFILELENQRFFYISFCISVIVFTLYLMQGLLLLKKKILL
jgi:hypothetical protein